MSPIRGPARWAFLLASWLVVVLVVVQVFLAGYGILVSPTAWGAHRELGHTSGVVILAMLLFGWLGRLAPRTLGHTLALYGLYALQYVFLEASLGWAGIRAFHAINALSLLVVGLHVARQARTAAGQTK